MAGNVKKNTAVKKKPVVKTNKPVQALPEGAIMVKVNGIDVTIHVQNLDDVDVLYQLRDANKGDIFAALDVLDVALGEEQRKMLVDTIRDPETGRASSEELGELLVQVFEAIPKS